jgi:purine-binding chemotaxis protein CheW
MDAVAEVGRPPHVTRVPGVPAWIAGVANWRGRIMPVLDLRILLGAPTVELTIAGRLMVLTRDGVTLAFLAERVEGVVGLELDRLEPVLLTLPRSTASVLSGQLADPDGPIALLDLDTIFALRSQLPRVRRAG